MCSILLLQTSSKIVLVWCGTVMCGRIVWSGAVMCPNFNVFNSLLDFKWSLLLVEIGDLLQKAPFENLLKRMKTTGEISIVFLLSDNASCWSSFIVFPGENGIQGGRLFYPLQEDSSCQCMFRHRCEVNILGKLAHDFIIFFKLPWRTFSIKSVCKI